MLNLWRTLAALVAVAALIATISCERSASSGRQGPIGRWQGAVEYRGARLDFGLDVSAAGDSLQALLSSPDLMMLDMPVDGVSWSGSHLRFEIPDEEQPPRFDGLAAGGRISGIVRVGAPAGAAPASDAAGAPVMEFKLERSLARAPDLPYTRTDVRIPSGDVTLAGTLLVPRSLGPHPAVVLLQGSSINRRDAYRYYADRFARSGIAALIFDKRGNGGSTGDYRHCTYDDLAADAVTTLDSLSRRPEIDSAHLGLWGLSQGAYLAPKVASLSAHVSFVVAVSGAAVPLGEVAAFQDSVRLRARAFPEGEAREAARLNRDIDDWVRSGGGGATLAAKLARVADRDWRRNSSLPRELPSRVDLGGWYWGGRTVDPLPWWRALRVPALVLYGEKDELVAAQPSAARVERAFAESGNRAGTVRVFPRANHMLKIVHLPSERDGGWDFPRAAPGAMDTVTSWMRRHAGLAP